MKFKLHRFIYLLYLFWSWSQRSWSSTVISIISISNREHTYCLIIIFENLSRLFVVTDFLDAFPLQVSLLHLLQEAAVCSPPSPQHCVSIISLHKDWNRADGFPTLLNTWVIYVLLSLSITTSRPAAAARPESRIQMLKQLFTNMLSLRKTRTKRVFKRGQAFLVHAPSLGPVGSVFNQVHTRHFGLLLTNRLPAAQ